MIEQSAKFIGAGLASISLAGSGVGIGVVFAGLIQGVARSSSYQKQLFVYFILDFEQIINLIEGSLAVISLVGLWIGIGIGVVFVGLVLGFSLLAGRRFFNISTSSNIQKFADLQPMTLPNSTLLQNIFQLLYTSLLFILFTQQRFNIGTILHCLLFISICIYYIGFKHSDRFHLFWSEIWATIKSQPNTFRGWFLTLKFLNFGWWISLLHIFFYTMPGYMIWSISTSVGALFAAIMSFTDGHIPKELFILWAIFNMGFGAISVSHFHFWLEKRKPFFYLFIKKEIVLLLVENPLLMLRIWERVGKPISGAAVAVAGTYVLGTYSNDRARVDMYKHAHDSAIQNGTPLPKVNDFLRENPSTSGTGGISITISLGGDTKAQR